MLKLAYKVVSRGGAMVSTSARNAGDPWFKSRSWYDRFLYVNIHLFILMPVSCNSSNLLIYIYIYMKEDINGFLTHMHMAAILVI